METNSTLTHVKIFDLETQTIISIPAVELAPGMVPIPITIGETSQTFWVHIFQLRALAALETQGQDPWNHGQPASERAIADQLKIAEVYDEVLERHRADALTLEQKEWLHVLLVCCSLSNDNPEHARLISNQEVLPAALIDDAIAIYFHRSPVCSPDGFAVLGSEPSVTEYPNLSGAIPLPVDRFQKPAATTVRKAKAASCSRGGTRRPKKSSKRSRK